MIAKTVYFFIRLISGQRSLIKLSPAEVEKIDLLTNSGEMWQF